MHNVTKTFMPILLSFLVGLNGMSAMKYEQKQKEIENGGEVITEKYTREELSFGIEGFEVKGELIKPKGQKEPLKLAIIVAGSGNEGNRDGKSYHPQLGESKALMYKDIAEGLAEKGIATFRYDKRLYAHGDKYDEKMLLNLTLEDEYLEDYNEILEYFSNRDYIDKDNIYTIGHSQGGSLIPLLEKTNPKATKYISLAGASTNLIDLIIEQYEGEIEAKKDYLSEEQLKELEDYINSFKDKINSLTNDSPNEMIGFFETYFNTKYILDIKNNDILEGFKNVDKPILFLKGENDWNVREKEIVAFENILGNRDDIEFKRYKGLNHAFMKGELEDNLWPWNGGKVEKEVIDDIAEFINK